MGQEFSQEGDPNHPGYQPRDHLDPNQRNEHGGGRTRHRSKDPWLVNKSSLMVSPHQKYNSQPQPRHRSHRKTRNPNPYGQHPNYHPPFTSNSNNTRRPPNDRNRRKKREGIFSEAPQGDHYRSPKIGMKRRDQPIFVAPNDNNRLSSVRKFSSPPPAPNQYQSRSKPLYDPFAGAPAPPLPAEKPHSTANGHHRPPGQRNQLRLKNQRERQRAPPGPDSQPNRYSKRPIDDSKSHYSRGGRSRMTPSMYSQNFKKTPYHHKPPNHRHSYNPGVVPQSIQAPNSNVFKPKKRDFDKIPAAIAEKNRGYRSQYVPPNKFGELYGETNARSVYNPRGSRPMNRPHRDRSRGLGSAVSEFDRYNKPGWRVYGDSTRSAYPGGPRRGPVNGAPQGESDKISGRQRSLFMSHKDLQRKYDKYDRQRRKVREEKRRRRRKKTDSDEKPAWKDVDDFLGWLEVDESESYHKKPTNPNNVPPPAPIQEHPQETPMNASYYPDANSDDNLMPFEDFDHSAVQANTPSKSNLDAPVQNNSVHGSHQPSVAANSQLPGLYNSGQIPQSNPYDSNGFGQSLRNGSNFGLSRNNFGHSSAPRPILPEDQMNAIQKKSSLGSRNGPALSKFSSLKNNKDPIGPPPEAQRIDTDLVPGSFVQHQNHSGNKLGPIESKLVGPPKNFNSNQFDSPRGNDSIGFSNFNDFNNDSPKHHKVGAQQSIHSKEGGFNNHNDPGAGSAFGGLSKKASDPFNMSRGSFDQLPESFRNDPNAFANNPIQEVDELQTDARYSTHRETIPVNEFNQVMAAKLTPILESGQDIFVENGIDEFPNNVQGYKKGLMDPQNMPALEGIQNMKVVHTCQMAPNYSLFPKTERLPPKIELGIFDTRYFHAATTALAERKELLYRLFLQEERLSQADGQFESISVALAQRSQFRLMVMDDRVGIVTPESGSQAANTRFIFAQPFENKETSLSDCYYVTFLEKAYGELNHGAWNINQGEIHHALGDLLGAPTEQVIFWRDDLTYKVPRNRPKEDPKKAEPEPGFLDKLMFWKKAGGGGAKNKPDLVNIYGSFHAFEEDEQFRVFNEIRALLASDKILIAETPKPRTGEDPRKPRENGLLPHSGCTIVKALEVEGAPFLELRNGVIASGEWKGKYGAKSKKNLPPEIKEKFNYKAVVKGSEADHEAERIILPIEDFIENFDTLNIGHYNETYQMNSVDDSSKNYSFTPNGRNFKISFYEFEITEDGGYYIGLSQPDAHILREGSQYGYLSLAVVLLGPQESYFKYIGGCNGEERDVWFQTTGKIPAGKYIAYITTEWEVPSCYNDSEDFTFWFYGEKLIPEAHKVKKIVCKSPDEADDLCIKLNEGLLDWYKWNKASEHGEVFQGEAPCGHYLMAASTSENIHMNTKVSFNFTSREHRMIYPNDDDEIFDKPSFEFDIKPGRTACVIYQRIYEDRGVSKPIASLNLQ